MHGCKLKKILVFKGSLPLAVPEINPRYVTATFVNESTVLSSAQLP